MPTEATIEVTESGRIRCYQVTPQGDPSSGVANDDILRAARELLVEYNAGVTFSSKQDGLDFYTVDCGSNTAAVSAARLVIKNPGVPESRDYLWAPKKDAEWRHTLEGAAPVNGTVMVGFMVVEASLLFGSNYYRPDVRKTLTGRGAITYSPSIADTLATSVDAAGAGAGATSLASAAAACGAFASRTPGAAAPAPGAATTDRVDQNQSEEAAGPQLKR